MVKRKNSDVVITVRADDKASGPLRNVGTQLDGMGKSATTAVGPMNQLRTAALGMATAFAGMQLVNALADLNQLGAEANKVEVRFTRVASVFGDTADMMGRFRAATGNVVTDTDLMAGSAKLFQMGLAQSGEEAAELLRIAVSLKDPFTSTGDAIENMALMLANQSYLRLDSLGISAAQVRERVDELKESGMEVEAAFSRAFAELGGEQVDRFALAVESAATYSERMAVAWANIRQDAGQTVNSFLEQGLAAAMDGAYGQTAALLGQRTGRDYLSAFNLIPESMRGNVNTFAFDQSSIETELMFAKAIADAIAEGRADVAGLLGSGTRDYGTLGHVLGVGLPGGQQSLDIMNYASQQYATQIDAILEGTFQAAEEISGAAEDVAASLAEAEAAAKTIGGHFKTAAEQWTAAMQRLDLSRDPRQYDVDDILGLSPTPFQSSLGGYLSGLGVGFDPSGAGAILGTSNEVSAYVNEVLTQFGSAIYSDSTFANPDQVMAFLATRVLQELGGAQVGGRPLDTTTAGQIIGGVANNYGFQFGGGGGGYTIQPGDTLGAIARAQGMTVDELYAANPQLGGRSMIIAGQELSLGTGGVFEGAAKLAESAQAASQEFDNMGESTIWQSITTASEEVQTIRQDLEALSQKAIEFDLVPNLDTSRLPEWLKQALGLDSGFTGQDGPKNTRPTVNRGGAIAN
jgi:LysM repeat protein